MKILRYSKVKYALSMPWNFLTVEKIRTWKFPFCSFFFLFSSFPSRITQKVYNIYERSAHRTNALLLYSIAACVLSLCPFRFWDDQFRRTPVFFLNPTSLAYTLLGGVLAWFHVFHVVLWWERTTKASSRGSHSGLRDLLWEVGCLVKLPREGRCVDFLPLALQCLELQ